jgi:hypothetical protein
MNVTNIMPSIGDNTINFGETDTTHTYYHGYVDFTDVSLTTGQPFYSILINPVRYSNTLDTSGLDQNGNGTGTLVVDGGTYIGKKLYVGDKIYTNAVEAIPKTDGNNYLAIGCDTSTNYIRIGHEYVKTINIGSVYDGSWADTGTPTTINIGAYNDDIFIRGNLYLSGTVGTYDVSNLQILDKTILLNDNAVGTGQSMGCGILIRDDNSNNAAYILVNNESNK